MTSVYIIGIDEVGRGPLAGPVLVCALALPEKWGDQNAKRIIKKVKDSKQLTAAQREEWYVWIKNNPEINYAVARVSPKIIDTINITQAANRAANRAYQKVLKKLNPTSFTLHPILDAGLKLPKHILHKTIVKADEKYPAVALASIIAKVTRDRSMIREHARYPQYDFAKHKGYGTPRHRQAIKRHGPCHLHRLTFIKNLAPNQNT